MTVEAIEIDVQIGESIFNDVYLPELENNTRTQIIFGGSSSGKSIFLVAQRTLMDVLAGGRNYLICRKVKLDIRGSVFEEIIKTIENWGLEDEFTINLTNMKITCNANGYQILFRGLDDVSKLKSITSSKGVITDILIEEATEVTRDDVKQLNKRLRGIDVFSDVSDMPKRLTMLFNPILKSHWIYKDYFSAINWEEGQTRYESDELTILKTTYKDNRFLTAEDIKELENEEDEYYYEVYTLGNWGILGDVIFKNWVVRDLTDEIPRFDNIYHGLDFGFASDPAAYIKFHYDKKKKTIYVIFEFYQTGLSDEALYDEIKDEVGQGYLMCDSAEPKSIYNLKSLGLKARAVKKGPDSVRHGIKWLQGHKIVIHIDCIRFKQEAETQQWKKDKWGETMAIPVDKNNHGMHDAARYAFESLMAKRKAGAPVTVRT